MSDSNSIIPKWIKSSVKKEALDNNSFETELSDVTIDGNSGNGVLTYRIELEYRSYGLKDSYVMLDKFIGIVSADEKDTDINTDFSGYETNIEWTDAGHSPQIVPYSIDIGTNNKRVTVGIYK